MQHPQPKGHSIKLVQLHHHLSIWMKTAKKENLHFCSLSALQTRRRSCVSHRRRPRHTSTFCLGSVLQLGGLETEGRYCARAAAALRNKTNKKGLQEIIHQSQASWQHIQQLFLWGGLFNSPSCAQTDCEVNKPTYLFFAGSLQLQERKEKEKKQGGGRTAQDSLVLKASCSTTRG